MCDGGGWFVCIARLLSSTCLGFGLATLFVQPLLGAPRMAERLEQIESAEATLCPLLASQGPLQPKVRNWAADLRPKVTTQAKPREIVDALNRFVLEKLAIKPSQDL